MKKIFFLILILFLLTGCDATYTLQLQDETMIESLSLINTDKTTWDVFKEFRNNDLNTVYAPDMYKVTKNDKENEISINYFAKFSIPEYSSSDIVNYVLYEYDETYEPEYTYDKEKIYIKVPRFNNAFQMEQELKNLTVIFKTNHNVLKHNADEIKEDAYYFYINKNNYQNKTIDLEVSRKADETKKLFKLDEAGYFPEKTLICFYIILGGLLLVGSIFVFIKIKNANR